MSEKILKSRIINKHDTEANWLKATNFIPKKGEIVVYDVDTNYNYERMKIGDGTTVVSSLPFIESSKAEEATHATTADKATNADHATKADSATTATTANSATKATQDASGNVITTTYETKTAAAAKLTEAKSYTDSEIAEWVGDKTVATQISNATANYYTKTQIDTYEFITVADIDEICGNVTEGGLPQSDIDELMTQLG